MTLDHFKNLLLENQWTEGHSALENASNFSRGNQFLHVQSAGQGWRADIHPTSILVTRFGCDDDDAEILDIIGGESEIGTLRKDMELVREALHRYHLALDNREHGGIAASHVVHDLETILKSPGSQGKPLIEPSMNDLPLTLNRASGKKAFETIQPCSCGGQVGRYRAVKLHPSLNIITGEIRWKVRCARCKKQAVTVNGTGFIHQNIAVRNWNRLQTQ